eukprot:144915-Amorphochlora_amoeboformis.AAC.1
MSKPACVSRRPSPPKLPKGSLPVFLPNSLPDSLPRFLPICIPETEGLMFGRLTLLFMALGCTLVMFRWLWVVILG